MMKHKIIKKNQKFTMHHDKKNQILLNFIKFCRLQTIKIENENGK